MPGLNAHTTHRRDSKILILKIFSDFSLLEKKMSKKKKRSGVKISLILF